MTGLPDRDTLIAWINDNPDHAAKREIARAFGVKGADRVELKRLIRELEDEGVIQRRGRRLSPAGHLPPVGLFTVTGPADDGEIYLVPKDWDDGETPPRILYLPRKADPPLKAGDTALAKLRAVKDEEIAYEARLIRRLSQGAPRRIGIFRTVPEGGGRIVPVDKKEDREWAVPAGAHAGARDGELVEAERVSRERFGLPKAKVLNVLGDPHAPKALSLIAMVEHGIPFEFPEAVLAEAEAAPNAPSPGSEREDLRHLPLVTIDPADARDHDDAVCALPDDDLANPGGHVVWVAIADVAHYVRPGSPLDGEARRRGNSTYFPDRVAPMLPERLSADLCSLMPGVDRPCLAQRLVIDAEGNRLRHSFHRGVMRSPAALSYEQAQAAADGAPDDETAPLVETAITPLWAAYRALARARERRQPLDLDLPERRVDLAEDGRVLGVTRRDRLDAHRLIEECMIQANVSAAETLERRKTGLLYRVHEEPAEEKLEALAETVDSIGLTLAKGQVLKTRHLNALLRAASESPHADVVNLSVLRAQTQAYYAPENLGHFGLALRAYAHFTSPIRRYADLVVHRALITALGLGEGGAQAELRGPDALAGLRETGEHISRTERRSMEAERDTTDRYLASFLAEREGAEFRGRITGVQRFGVFVALEETGADGLLPIRALGDEYFHHDYATPALIGEVTGQVFTLGQWLTVRLVEAVPVTGGLLFDLVSAEAAPGESAIRGAGGRGKPGGKGQRAGNGPRRRLTRERIAAAKAKRKGRRRG
ncbi:MAG: ribonuclease R [Pseudomonadota bacterium]